MRIHIPRRSPLAGEKAPCDAWFARKRAPTGWGLRAWAGGRSLEINSAYLYWLVVVLIIFVIVAVIVIIVAVIIFVMVIIIFDIVVGCVSHP